MVCSGLKVYLYIHSRASITYRWVTPFSAPCPLAGVNRRRGCLAARSNHIPGSIPPAGGRRSARSPSQ